MVEVSQQAPRRRPARYYRSMLVPIGGWRSTTDKSKERRRRRIQMRRNAAPNGGALPAGNGGALPAANGGTLPSAGGATVMGYPAAIPACRPGSQQGGSIGGGGTTPWLRPDAGAAPVVGAVAVAGRLERMEDAVTVRTSLCTPAINRCRPVHFYGVFDGHGGPHVAITCKNKMHEILEEEIMRAEYPVPPRSPYRAAKLGSPAPPRPGFTIDESVLQEAWRMVFVRAFSKTEVVALHTCSSCGIVGFNCRCGRRVAAFSGSTAVAVVLTDEHVVVANCGDSRAVMSRGGRVVPLSFDHKPDRADEKARIEASGGKVFGADTPRVQGILAMSRAIGAKFLKPHVISEPEVTFTRRDPEDEFLILASDGLWDVMSTQTACMVARGCLKDPLAEAGPGGSRGLVNVDEPGAFYPSRSASAAALLIRLAVARKSGDNVCVVVVDLKRVN